MQWIFLLFPLLELWTLIELGSAYGAMVAIGWVVLTIVLGLSLIRRQGLSMIRQIQREAEGGLVGARLLGDDIAVVTSGLLLMIPGLVTDVLAVLVLIGPLRRRLLGAAPARFRSDARVTVTRRYTAGLHGNPHRAAACRRRRRQRRQCYRRGRLQASGRRLTFSRGRPAPP